jgi:uncharacterized membrane protein
MGFKGSEIALIVLAILIPVGLFGALLVPGGMSAIVGILADPVVRPIAFGGAALVVFGVLCYRVYSRIRPRKRPPAASTYDPTVAAHARETWKIPK